MSDHSEDLGPPDSGIFVAGLDANGALKSETECLPPFPLDLAPLEGSPYEGTLRRRLNPVKKVRAEGEVSESSDSDSVLTIVFGEDRDPDHGQVVGPVVDDRCLLERINVVEGNIETVQRLDGENCSVPTPIVKSERPLPRSVASTPLVAPVASQAPSSKLTLKTTAPSSKVLHVFPPVPQPVPIPIRCASKMPIHQPLAAVTHGSQHPTTGNGISPKPGEVHRSPSQMSAMSGRQSLFKRRGTRNSTASMQSYQIPEAEKDDVGTEPTPSVREEIVVPRQMEDQSGPVVGATECNDDNCWSDTSESDDSLVTSNESEKSRPSVSSSPDMTPIPPPPASVKLEVPSCYTVMSQVVVPQRVQYTVVPAARHTHAPMDLHTLTTPPHLRSSPVTGITISAPSPAAVVISPRISSLGTSTTGRQQVARKRFTYLGTENIFSTLALTLPTTTESPSQRPAHTFRDPRDMATCPLCVDVCERALRLSCCDNVACSACIWRWLTHSKSCPFCRSELDPSRVGVASDVQRLVDRLIVRCKVPGCEWIGRRDRLVRHVESCTGGLSGGYEFETRPPRPGSRRSFSMSINRPTHRRSGSGTSTNSRSRTTVVGLSHRAEKGDITTSTTPIGNGTDGDAEFVYPLRRSPSRRIIIPIRATHPRIVFKRISGERHGALPPLPIPMSSASGSGGSGRYTCTTTIPPRTTSAAVASCNVEPLNKDKSDPAKDVSPPICLSRFPPPYQPAKSRFSTITPVSIRTFGAFSLLATCSFLLSFSFFFPLPASLLELDRIEEGVCVVISEGSDENNDESVERLEEQQSDCLDDQWTDITTSE
ncbi:hypothetical protein HDU85_003883 [Gaertneriomyces sp. JEL0708]|nr:hypothetical protein HDU85_003883 [Gaertneriomyces sp. JEL0708]